MEQDLCLLGSANTQLSILRRQRVLATINRSRTNLAELPLPNAKSWLFGDDFPSLASKQAELSRGLTKNLVQSTGKCFPRCSSQPQSKHRDTFNKYQSTGYSNPSTSQITKGHVQKRGFFVPLPRRDASQTLRLHSVLENPNIGPTDPLNCFRLQDKLLQNPFSKICTIYPNIGLGGAPYIPGSERVIPQRGHTTDPFYQRRFLQPPISCSQKGRIYASGDRPKFFEQIHCKRAFPDGKPQLSKDVAFTRRFYDKYRFKRCLSFCICAQDFPKVPSLPLEGNILPVQGSSVRPVFSSQNFYEGSKTCRRIPEEESHSSPYIPGRLSSSGGRKNHQNSSLLLTFARFSKYHIAKPSKLNRFVRVLETSHLAVSTALSSLTIRSDKGPTNEPGVL